MKKQLIFYLFALMLGMGTQYARGQQCTVSSATVFHSADNSGNRFRNNPENTSDNLLPFITVSDISGGSYVNSAGQNFCTTEMGNATLFKKSGVGTAYNASVFYDYTITTAASSPIIYANRFSAILPAFDGVLNNPTLATDRLSYYLRVSIIDGTNSVETVILNSILINQMPGNSAAVDYKMLPGRTYTIRYYAWKATNSCTDLYLDNPRLYLSPIPNSTPNACASNLSGTVGTALAPNVSSTTPTGLTLRWLQGTTNVTGNTITAGTYTPYYYNASSNCYFPAGNSVTVSTGPTFTTNQTAGTQTVCQNVKPAMLFVEANNVTYQWYTNTTNSNTGGTPISGATSNVYAPPSSNTLGTIYYYAVITDTSTGCSTASVVRAITVQGLPVITAQPNTTPQSVCVNGTLTPLSVTATNATTYQWYYSTAALGGTVITLSGATSSTYTPSSAVAFPTRYYFVTVSNSCGSVTSSPRTPITVNNNPGSFLIYPGSQTTTLNSTPYNLGVTISSGGPATSYQWYSNSINSNTGGTLISGANTATYTPPTTALGTLYYYAVVGNSSGCTATSPTASVTVENCRAADPISVNLNSWFTVTNGPAGTEKQWHTSATPTASTLISSGTVMATSTPTNYWVYYYDTTNMCYSPGSKVVVVSNDCCNRPNVDLTALPQSTPPSGSVLRWFTTNNHQAGTQVSNPTIAGDGAYFPFFYNESSNSYSDVGIPVLVSISDQCSSNADIQVNKTGPYNVASGATLSYKVYVTNNGASNASNVVVKDPAVANFTVSSVICENGWGNGGESVCPSSVTVTELQSSGLIIPSLPAGSAVVFTVSGTASNKGSITNTATVEFTGDTDSGNNTSTVVTSISSATCSETTYKFNPSATVAANPVSINGGTINLVYSRNSGVAISGIGESFTLPVTYSDLNNQFGVDNQWEFIVTTVGVSIVPKTSTTAGGLFNGLPAPNATTTLPIVNYDSTDYTLSYHLRQGTILPLGQFTLGIGNYPSLPLNVSISAQSFQTYTYNNDSYATTYITSGYYLKPLIQNKTETAFSAGTLPIEMQPGQSYRYRYTAVGDGSSGNAGNRGLIFRSSNYITFKYNCSCYKPGLATGGSSLDTKVGISALGRAGANDADNWPMIRKGGHIALESKTKAFVPNRVAFNASGNPIGIAPANFIEGMMVYDTTNKCLKIYTLKEGDNQMAWHCFTTQTCPD